VVEPAHDKAHVRRPCHPVIESAHPKGRRHRAAEDRCRDTLGAPGCHGSQSDPERCESDERVLVKDASQPWPLSGRASDTDR
jgi:hypothetical protein